MEDDVRCGNSGICFRVGRVDLHISGGTGKFEDATGEVTNIGEVDLSKNATVFRYSSQVCFAERH